MDGGMLIARAAVIDTNLALPDDLVGVLFQLFHAQTEVFQLRLEFCGKLFDPCLVFRRRAAFLCHRPCHHLRHLEPRDRPIAAVRPVAVSFDDAVGGEGFHSIVRPVVFRNIGKGIFCGECRAGNGAGDESGSGEESMFFHSKIPFFFEMKRFKKFHNLIVTERNATRKGHISFLHRIDVLFYCTLFVFL